MLAVQSICKTYPNQTQFALKNVSFSLQAKEILAIVGESGSGKTTLLKIIANMEDSDTGTVFLHQKQIFGSAYSLVRGHKRIKLVQQDFDLLPRHKIYENIAYPLRLYPKDEQQARIEQLLQWCNLEKLADKYPNELSGGELQRVALAVALADKPDLLLLDEPFSHLDRPLKLRLRREIKEILQKSGIAAILVTHEIEDAFYLAEKLAIMQNGEMVQLANAKEIYQAPKNKYIANLVGHRNIVAYKNIRLLLPKYAKQDAEKFVIIPNHAIKIDRLNKANAKIKECIFLGEYYEVVIQYKDILLILTQQVAMPKNISIHVSIESDSLYVINS
jgi:iron(III) transport system ATP-binding protein